MDRTNSWNDDTEYDFAAIVASRNQYLRLRATPVGMRRFRNASEMEEIHRLRRPPEGVELATDQIVRGLAALGKNGPRYPIPNHGLDKSPLTSLA